MKFTQFWLLSSLHKLSMVGLVAFLALATSQSAKAADPKDVKCNPDDVCRIGTTGLPLRVLPRPLSSLYNAPKDSPDAIIKQNIPAFKPLIVRKRQNVSFADPTNPTGWYEVTTGVKAPGVGWMKAKDVLEWRNLLVVAYTHPGSDPKNRREQVLMFKELDTLKKAVESKDRPGKFKSMAAKIKQGGIPDGVISSEPSRYLNIDQNFYILPVLQFEQYDGFDDDARYLQIAAAVPGKRADPGKADTLKNKNFIKEVNTQSKFAEKGALSGVDIVFVMDMTSSMGPHIEMTKSALTDVAKMVSQKAADPDTIRYGLVGYRDDHAKHPSLGYTAENFTPELIKGEQDFINVIQDKAQAAKAGSGDYTEEVYAGLKLAIEDIKWRNNAIKFIVLVGDASAHEPGHPQSTTGLGAQQIRTLADSKNIQILGIHLKVQRAAADHPIALAQFRIVTDNKGTDSGPAVHSIGASDEAAYQGAVKDITVTLVTGIQNLKQGTSLGKLAAGGTSSSNPASGGGGTKLGKAAISALQAALITYLGKEANPPKDLTIWAMDRDMVDPSIAALSVRVMISKKDLDNLYSALEQLSAALARQSLTEAKFFDALQGVVSGGAMGQKVTLKKGQKLAKSGLLPAWIDSLPYKSAILSMSDDQFDQLSADDRAQLEKDIEGKMSLYQDLLEGPENWKKLHEKAAALDAVYPLPIEELP